MADDPIRNLLDTYNELNGTAVSELAEEPSPLEFLRYVAQNRPFVVRNAAANWPAVQKWDAAYLRQTLSEVEVCVAVTPKGNADAVVEHTDGQLLFVQPYEISRRFGDFLNDVQKDSQMSEMDDSVRNVQYGQTQNDNLRDEYESLFADVPAEMDFARVALDKTADAVNFWLGNHRSVTMLHKDPYQNLYVQIRGSKHFVLLPPTAMPCVNEQVLRCGRYKPKAEAGEDCASELVIDLDHEKGSLPVPIWDPDEPIHRQTQYSDLARPLRVTLSQGDMLYLPAMWFHKVTQSVGDEAFALAVNYWYDMDFEGSFWATNAFVRDVVNASKMAVPYPELTLNDEEKQ